MIAAQLVEEKDIAERFKSLGLYFGTVMAGLLIHGLIILPIIYSAFTRKLPFKYLGNMSQAMMTAFGTSSRFFSNHIAILQYFAAIPVLLR